MWKEAAVASFRALTLNLPRGFAESEEKSVRITCGLPNTRRQRHRYTDRFGPFLSINFRSNLIFFFVTFSYAQYILEIIVMMKRSISSFGRIYGPTFWAPTTPTEYEKWLLVCRLSIRTSVCMCASLAPERLNEFYSYSVCKCSCIIGRCPVHMHILDHKTMALRWVPKHEMAIFSKTAQKILIKLQ
jgi:hypothetical protein